MQANLYATFRLLAKTKTIALDLKAGVTAHQAVLRIVELYPDLRTHWLGPDGDLHAHVHMFINGREIGTLPDGIQTRLGEQDMLDFFPPVGGGSGKPAVVVLAMHGAPPLDFPHAELAEFMALDGRIAHAPPGAPPPSPEIVLRYAALENRLRAWPRTPLNDPFFSGAQDLAAALERASGLEVIVGFNEFCAPALDAALDTAAEQAGGRPVVIVTPMMTRGGEHSEHDIPAAIEEARARHPGVDYRYAWPLDLGGIAAFRAGQVKKAVSG